jgi:transposase
VDNLGRLLKLVLSPGQSADYTYAPELAGQAIEYQAQAVVADKGYYGNALRGQIENAGLEAVIPFRKCCKIRPEIDRNRYRDRNIVERFIGKIKENRRVATRYDKKATHFAGFLILAAIKAWLKIIC